MRKSFTLIELLVVLSVFLILSGLLVVSFRSGGMGSALRRDAAKIALNLRRVEEMSIAAKTFSDAVPSDNCSNCYGIEFVGGRNYYTVFADLDKDYRNDGGREFIENIYLEGDNRIRSNPYYKIIYWNTNFSVSNLTVVFIPPDPIVRVNRRDDSNGFIVVEDASDTSVNKLIEVNRAGLINVHDL
jgi:prepilin-type N-terminal cleavage/methylation domain-containing protein